MIIIVRRKICQHWFSLKINSLLLHVRILSLVEDRRGERIKKITQIWLTQTQISFSNVSRAYNTRTRKKSQLKYMLEHRHKWDSRRRLVWFPFYFVSDFVTQISSHYDLSAAKPNIIWDISVRWRDNFHPDWHALNQISQIVISFVFWCCEFSALIFRSRCKFGWWNKSTSTSKVLDYK